MAHPLAGKQCFSHIKWSELSREGGYGCSATEVEEGKEPENGWGVGRRNDLGYFMALTMLQSE